MGDINPQIDLVYVCFLQGRVYNLLKNRKFHEVSSGIPCVAWEKSRYGKARQIDALRKKQPGTVSRNTWIAQAIEDKLEGEGKTGTD